MTEAPGLRKGERLQQHRVESRKDRAVRPNAEGQRENDRGGEGWGSGQGAQGPAEIADQRVQPARHFHLDGLFEFHGRVAKLAAGFACGVGGAQTGVPQLVDALLDVEDELSVHVTPEAIPAENGGAKIDHSAAV